MQGSSQTARWIPYKDEKCTSIQEVQPRQTAVSAHSSPHTIVAQCIAARMPDSLQISRSESLRLRVDNLPSISTTYLCQFAFAGGVKRTEQARVQAEGSLACQSPDKTSLPSIAPVRMPRPHNKCHE